MQPRSPLSHHQLKRLVLLGCSERKRSQSGAVPAIELYDGPSFRALRKYLASGQPAPRAVVLSSKYGLIEATLPIEWYDERLLESGVTALEARVRDNIEALLKDDFDEIFISLGTHYAAAIRKVLENSKADASITCASGAPGVRAAMLAKWLNQSQPTACFSKRMRDKFRIAGQDVLLTHDTVVEAVRRQLASFPAESQRFHSWSVTIDGRGVSPKWVLSICTGISVNRFSTHSACRVLASIGFDLQPL